MIKISIFTLSQLQRKKGYLLPNAVGCNSQLDCYPGTGESNYENIDDPVLNPDDDLTYVYSTATDMAKYDLYNLSPWIGNTTGTINGITVYSRGKGEDFIPPGAEYYLLLSPSCPTYYESNDQDITNVYKAFSYSWRENPSTSTDWDWTDLENLQVGVKLKGNIAQYDKRKILDTIGAGHYTEWWSHVSKTYCESVWYCDLPNWGLVHDYFYTCGGIDDRFCYVIRQTAAGAGGEYLDSYIFESVPSEGAGSYITKVTMNVEAYRAVPPEEVTINLKGFLRISGTNYYSDTWIMDSNPEGYTLYSHTWETNPAGGAWQWGDVAAIEGGIHVIFPVPPETYQSQTAYVRMVQIITEYKIGNINPAIKCTQTYAEIDYSETVECTLNKPEEISVDHSRNIKMLNFWDGSREVYDLSRSNKTMVLTGKEYQSSTCNKDCPSEHIECIRAMGKEGATITIAGLSFDLFNGDYKIRSFGWKHISEKPEVYEWILELEDDT